jgi:hypothetical protein
MGKDRIIVKNAVVKVYVNIIILEIDVKTVKVLVFVNIINEKHAVSNVVEVVYMNTRKLEVDVKTVAEPKYALMEYEKKDVLHAMVVPLLGGHYIFFNLFAIQ